MKPNQDRWVRPTALFAVGAALGLAGGFVWLIDLHEVGVMVSGLTTGKSQSYVPAAIRKL